ncbi:hypothetical protein PsorP6_016113 [Peronosclerospora sorghi]|uniref:Uncharacterized protein n=1 Tax=Peronosclerospora sorghi TaxID=230839 RepID=A0ACC0VL87_9STRA|nr:hypothetical protein PsorP6_016113 [Peronosclerospora sorghi]
MDGTVHIPKLDMLSRLFIGESFVEESEEMAQDYIEKMRGGRKYGDEQVARRRVQARGSIGGEKVIRLRLQSCLYEYRMWREGSEEVAVWPIWSKY